MNAVLLLRHYSVYLFITLFLSVIAAHMYFIYMAEYNTVLARGVRDETHSMKDGLMTAPAVSVSSQDRVAVSHLIIAEPLTVSVSSR